MSSTNTSSTDFIEKPIRNNNANKRKHRYVDQKLARMEKIKIKNLRQYHFDDDDGDE